MEYPEEESTNRPFIIASVALGGLFVAGLVALGLYAFKIRPAQASTSATQVAEINASNTQVAEYAEATSVAQVAAVMVPESEQQARLAGSRIGIEPDRSGGAGGAGRYRAAGGTLRQRLGLRCVNE